MRRACESSQTYVGITGTDDNSYVTHENSLVIAGKVPGAWLVQIENAGHAVMDQYPDEINKILQTFLSTTNTATTAQPELESVSTTRLFNIQECDRCRRLSSIRFRRNISTVIVLLWRLIHL
jgi:hypothetical protein